MQHYPFTEDDIAENDLSAMQKRLDYEFKIGGKKSIRYKELADKLLIYKLGKSLGLTKTQTEIKWMLAIEEAQFSKQHSFSYKHSQMPKLPKQDNKGYYNGGGGGGSNRVRYPSTKRSKRVWKAFYELFPYYAERDVWDGEKSKRYNPKKK